MPLILVTDDSPTIRKMVMASLRAIPNATFIEASNGLESIEAITLQKPDAVVLDINMPDMNGVEVLEFIRQHPACSKTPVLILTTRNDDEIKERVITLGAAGFISKPFQPAVLVSALKKLLNM
ncbi:response regulator [Tenuifilum thalassicum]|uniref:Response regulator n=1 Tax=Tenuifilum thalassicum TaxID=2590900 RepID=A0A7D3XM48_9BACT|nr:response regulator [Tenuifilum thalassicum]QKG79956.1 response regulator [Tenuifilum thalassicum]